MAYRETTSVAGPAVHWRIGTLGNLAGEECVTRENIEAHTAIFCNSMLGLRALHS